MSTIDRSYQVGNDMAVRIDCWLGVLRWHVRIIGRGMKIYPCWPDVGQNAIAPFSETEWHDLQEWLKVQDVYSDELWAYLIDFYEDCEQKEIDYLG